MGFVETKNKSIAVVASKESEEERKEVEQAVIKACEKITRGSTEKALVLSIILREMVKLKKGEKVGFDFGTAKEWQLKRVK